jgi:flagellar hook-basal body complex protein FliE
MNQVQLQKLERGDERPLLPQPRSTGKNEFGGVLSSAIDKVDSLQKTAESNLVEFIAGERDDVHEVVIAMNEAQLAFQFMTEVRNRMLEGYQELMRMQV